MSSVATGSAEDLIELPVQRISLMQQPLDHFNPNVGWIIGPIAFATGWIEANLVQVDLSWAEMLYSIAAVLYAVAALIKSLRDKNLPQSTRKKISKSSVSSGDSDDTIEVR